MVVTIEDVNGTTSFNYDNPFDPTLVTNVTYDDGSKVTYDYDHVGRLQQVIYGEGREALAYTYNYEDGTTDKYVYNADGLLTKSVNRRGQEIAYEYNDRYQVAKEIHGDGSILAITKIGDIMNFNSRRVTEKD